MNLRDLEYLVALADHRHFGRAADACFVSQPTLSAQVRKLEVELGVELVERTPRNIMLTAAGELIVERARGMLREADAIRDVARRTRDPESGSLRLGIFPTLAPYLLPHLVSPLRDRFPRLELLLVEEKTEEVVARLRDGRLDAGVLALPIDEAGLVHRPLFDEEFVLAVPRGHHLATRSAPLPVDALRGESVLLLEDGHCLRSQALSVCQMVGASERRGFRATSLETLRQMVASGVGMTLLPHLAVSAPVPASPDIALVPFEAPVPSRTIALFWRSTSPFGSLMPALAEVMAALPASLVRPASERPDHL